MIKHFLEDISKTLDMAIGGDSPRRAIIEVNKLIADKLKELDGTVVQLQVREIGEGDWRNAKPEQYEYYSQSPEWDTRFINIVPVDQQVVAYMDKHGQVMSVSEKQHWIDNHMPSVCPRPASIDYIIPLGRIMNGDQ